MKAKLHNCAAQNALPNAKAVPFERSIWDALTTNERRAINKLKDRLS